MNRYALEQVQEGSEEQPYRGNSVAEVAEICYTHTIYKSQ